MNHLLTLKGAIILTAALVLLAGGAIYGANLAFDVNITGNVTLTVTGDPIQVLSADGVTPINSGDSLDFGTASVDFFGRGPVPVRGPFFLKNLSNGPVQVVVTGDLRDDIVPLFGSTIEDLKPAPGNAFTLAAPGTTGDTLRGFLGLKFLAPTAGSKQTTIIFRATATGDLGADVCSGGGGCIVVASSNDNRVYIYDPVNLNLLAAVGSGDLTFPQSVAIGPDSRVYVGTSGQVIAIDLTTGDAVSLGAGILGGFIYGTTVSTGGIIYASGSSMAETRTLTLTGVHAGNIASPKRLQSAQHGFWPRRQLLPDLVLRRPSAALVARVRVPGPIRWRWALLRIWRRSPLKWRSSRGEPEQRRLLRLQLGGYLPAKRQRELRWTDSKHRGGRMGQHLGRLLRSQRCRQVQRPGCGGGANPGEHAVGCVDPADMGGAHSHTAHSHPAGSHRFPQRIRRTTA